MTCWHRLASAWLIQQSVSDLRYRFLANGRSDEDARFETLQPRDEEAVVVGIEVRKHGRTRVREDRYRKSRGLKSVTFTLGTESPMPALGPTRTATR